MMLLHKINLPNAFSIKLIRDIPKQKIVRILTEGNMIYDVDIQNARILISYPPSGELT